MRPATPEAGAPGSGAGATVTQAGERRLARVESVRALAALGVVFSHAFLLAQVGDGRHGDVSDSFGHRLLLGGGLGVWLFFALTGYLLYWPFARRDFAGGPPVDLRPFARNRALRILPLYYAVLVVVLVLQEGGGSTTQWVHFATFTQNLSRTTAGTVDGPMWSLGVEVEFYALLPAVAWVLARVARGRPAAALAALLLVGAAAMGLHEHLVVHRAPADPRYRYSLPVTFGFFAAGMALALVRAGAPRAFAGRLGNGDLWLLASLPLWLLVVDDYQREWLCAPASALVLGACVLAPRPGPLTRVLDRRPLALVGVASYSLYLVHFPLLDAIDGHVTSVAGLLVVGGGASLALAACSYRLVEAPFLALRRRWS